MSVRQHTGAIKLVENDWIDLEDGVRLAIRLWLPHDAGGEHRVSAILDSVPYRKSDGTAIGDAAWGTYFAGRGFAYARVDLRGSGDSSGLLADEYTEQEQLDSERVLEWLASRPWSSGSVGMIGVSWGAFAALQMAARAPAQLKGIVPIHGSDDRYADDVHYVGGCVSAMDMAHWATSMMAYLNQPPDPEVVGAGWREMWHERLENATFLAQPWLTHQRRDDYWRGGSACENYGGIACPVFAVGGWSDGYRDMVLRVLESVSAPVRGLIGPWGHTCPEDGKPGPAIGFLQECVRFFEAALDGVDNGFLEGPRLISYMQEPVAPAGSYRVRAGRWLADAEWPSPAVTELRLDLAGAVLVPSGAALVPSSEASGELHPRSLRGLQCTGIDGGVWCGDGGASDYALDQRGDDGASLCWDTEPLEDRIEILGRCEAELEVSVDRPQALIAVRVCDVAPDGASTLVARGILNLSRREGHDRSVPMPIDEPVAVRIPCQSIGYAVPAGHRLRLALSDTYWPWAWPSPEPATVTVHRGGLTVPQRHPSPADADPPTFGAAETGEALASDTTLLRPTGRRVRRDLATGEAAVDFDWHASASRIRQTDTEMGEENSATYRIVEGDPLSATVAVKVAVWLRRPGWDTRTVVTSTMTCDRERFTVSTGLDAYEHGIRVHASTRTFEIPRDGV
jgi:putative CocE/NonD family hydrolase